MRACVSGFPVYRESPNRYTFYILNFKIDFTEDAVLDYNKEDDSKITFLHTNVPESCQGKGVGKILAEVINTLK